MGIEMLVGARISPERGPQFQPWLDADTKKSGPVLYLAAEGSESLVERMKAWEIHHDTTVLVDGFQVIRTPPDLSDGAGRNCGGQAVPQLGYHNGLRDVAAHKWLWSSIVID
jgi:hypothetical protein